MNLNLKAKMPNISNPFKKKAKEENFTDSTIETKRKEFKKTTLIETLIVTVVTVFVTLHMDHYLAKHNRFDWSQAFGAIIKNPFGFIPINYKISITLIAFLAIFAFTLLRYTVDKLKIHDNLDGVKGKAKWNTPEALNNKLADKNDFKNTIISKNIRMSLNQRIHHHFLSTLVMGTSGSGKTRYQLKPIMMQMNANFAVCDPSGDILSQCGESLRRNGYKIKIFDSGSLDNCSYYNPLKYVQTELDIKNLVETFMMNMNKEGQQSQDPFWDKSFNAFLSSLIAFLTLVDPGEEKPYGQIAEVTGGKIYSPTFATCAEFTRMAGTKYSKQTSGIKLYDENMELPKNCTELGVIFKNLEYYTAEKQGVHVSEIEKCYALAKWQDFCIAPEKTSSSILMVSATNLDAFNVKEVRNITSKDTLDLFSLGTERVAFFLVVSISEPAFTFLVSFLYTQMFSILYKKCENKLTGYNLENTSNIYLPNTDFVKHFNQEEVIAGIDEEFYQKIKNGNIRIEEIIESDNMIPLPNGGSNKDAIYNIYVDDTWVSARPTMKLAEEYVSELKKSELKKTGSGFQPLPFHMRMLMDEFKNTAQIPNFLEKLATLRKYEIDCVIFVQDYSQLEELYEKNHGELLTNCPQTIFLAGSNPDANEKVSKMSGTTTKVLTTNSIDGKKNVSTSQQIEGVELIKPEDLAKLPFNQLWFKTQGEDPTIDEMYDYVEHPNYIYTNDYAEEKGIVANVFKREELFPSAMNNVKVYINKVKAKAIPSTKTLTPSAFMEIMGVYNLDDVPDTMNEDFYDDDFYDAAEA